MQASSQIRAAYCIIHEAEGKAKRLRKSFFYSKKRQENLPVRRISAREKRRTKSRKDSDQRCPFGFIKKMRKQIKEMHACGR